MQSSALEILKLPPPAPEGSLFNTHTPSSPVSVKIVIELNSENPVSKKKKKKKSCP